jgi:hypothetical protein
VQNRAELLTAKRRNRNLFWTGDESWILWNMQQSGSWVKADEELPVRIEQAVGAQKSMLTVFLNSRSFAAVDLLSQGTPFDAYYKVFHPSVASHSLRGSRVQKVPVYAGSIFDDGERGPVSAHIFRGTSSGCAPCQKRQTSNSNIYELAMSHGYMTSILMILLGLHRGPLFRFEKNRKFKPKNA